MVETGNPNSVSDAGVGALCARSAVIGAFMNVRINAAGYDDRSFVEEVIKKGKEIEYKTIGVNCMNEENCGSEELKKIINSFLQL